MSLKVSLLCSLVAAASSAWSQLMLPPSPNQVDDSGKRTGHWTLTYDSLWRETSAEDSIYYYRLIRFENGKPDGKIRDFYRTGVKQWEGYMSSLYPEVHEDECLTYHENGRLKYRNHYRHGIAWGTAEEYYPSGQLMSKGEYVDGQQSGEWTFYFEDGKVAATVPYQNGLWSGPAQFNHANGSLDHRGTYVSQLAEGRHEFFSPAGIRTMTVHYRKDTLEGPAEFYNEVGQLGEKGSHFRGSRQGIWTTYHPNGQVSSVGKYQGLSEGEWIFYHENGRVRSRGMMQHGKYQGVWETFTSEGKPEAREEFVDGLRSGECLLFFPDGRVKQRAYYRMDSLHGDFVDYGEDGGVMSKGAYGRNVRVGHWVFFSSAGQKEEEGDYTQGLKSGQWKKFAAKGLLWRSDSYRYDSLHGRFEEFFPGGGLKEEGAYRDGLLDSAYAAYYENGKKREEGSYDRGRKEGVWRYYHESGSLQVQLSWRNDVMVGPFTMLFPSGTPSLRGQHAEGSRTGTFTSYYENGKLKAEGAYQAGRESGTWMYYDSLEGKKYAEVPFVNGKWHGTVLYYTKEKISSREYYVHGFAETYRNIQDSINRLIGLKEYDKALTAVAWMEKVIRRDTKAWSARALPSSYYANIYYAQDRADKSLEFALENLKLYKKNKAIGTEGYGISLHNVATAYSGLGRMAEAIPYFDESIAIARQRGLDASYWASVMGKAYALMDHHEELAAMTLVDAEWALAVEHFGADSAATFALESKLGDFHFYKRTDYDAAATWYGSLKDKIERRQLYDQPELFHCYKQLAYITDVVRKQYPDAVSFYEQGILHAERTGMLDPDYDNLLVDYFSLRIDQLPDTTVQRTLVERMASRVAEAAGPLTKAKMYHALGLTNYQSSHNRAAMTYQQKGIEFCEQQGLTHTRTYAALLQNLAMALQAEPEPNEDAVLNSYREAMNAYARIVDRTDAEYYGSLTELGGLFVNYRRFDEAIATLTEVIAILKTVESPEYQAKASYYLGDAYVGKFEYHHAVIPYEQALLYYKKNYNDHLPELGHLYSALAGCYREDLAKAMASAQKAMEIAEQRFGKESLPRLVSLSKLAELEVANGLATSARLRYLEVANGYRQLDEEQSPGYFSALLGMMHADVVQHDYARARDLGEKTRPLAEKTLGISHQTTLNLVYELSLAYEGLRQEAKQEACLRQLVEAYRSQQSHIVGQMAFATYQLALGTFYMQRNKLPEAEIALEESVRTMRKSDLAGTIAMGNYVVSLAQVKERIGKNAEAEQLYQESFRLAASDSLNNFMTYVNAGSDLASFYQTMGRYSESESLIEDLSAFYLRHRPQNMEYITLRLPIVWYYYFREDEKKALQEAQRLLTLAEAEGGVGHPTTLSLHNYMGVVLYDTDRFEEAREHFQYCADAMLRRSNLSALDLGTLAAYFGNLADTEMALGHRGPAESFLNQSESNYQKAGAVRQPVQLAVSKQRRASLHQLKGEWPAAEKEWLTLTRSLMRYAMENFAFQSENEKTQFWSSVSVPFRKFRSFAIDRATQNPDILGTLYDLQLATKGILLSSSNRIRKRLLGSRDSTLINQYYQWMRLREHLGQLYAQPGHRASATDSLSRSINILEKEMNVTAEDIRDEKGGPPVTWQQVQASLGPDEAAVEILRFRYFNGYVRDSVIYAALVLTDKTLRAPALVIIPDGKRMEKQYYAAHKNAMTYQMDDTVSYRRYWAPLTKVIGKRSKVYLSLDGVYHQLSLSALRSPDGRYLADLKSLTIVSNTKDVLSVKSRKPTRNRSFSASLFGFPSFYLGDDQKKKPGASRGGMEPLTGTRIEVDRISALLTESHVRTEVFVGERATEGAIKRTRQPTLLHIATHGFFQEEGKPAAFNLTGVNEGNPLNRSGLLLAGAANYVQEGQLTDEENGILTAYEVSNLNLESAELVALSACETGRGVVQNGEGVYGLQRAFQSAGAKSILLSLWKVDDAATQRLMSEFYRNWLQGQGKAEALRRAQVTVKAEFPHPYYWGAFILMEN